MSSLSMKDRTEVEAAVQKPWPVRYMDLCSAWKPCVTVGGLGYDSFAKYRSQLMEATAWLSSLAVVLLIVPIVATSSGSDEVMDTHWSRADGDKNVWIYLGLSHIIFKKGEHIRNISWEDEDCPDSWCEDCKFASLYAKSVVIAAFVLSILQMTTDLYRSVTQHDTNFKKCVAICLGAGATGCTFAGVSMLSRHCFRHLPGTVDFPDDLYTDLDVSWSYGPAFFCMVVAAIMQLNNAVLHLLTPTVKRGVVPPDAEESGGAHALLLNT